MDKIQNIAKKHNLDIIEDSAQALDQNLKINAQVLVGLPDRLAFTLQSCEVLLVTEA